MRNIDSILPTKTNLMKLKSTIKLSEQGQELLEKKKYILIQEREKYKKEIAGLREKLKQSQERANMYLRQTNVNIGIEEVHYISRGIEIDNGIDIKYLTIMGVNIPSIVYEEPVKQMHYGVAHTPMSLDKAIEEFNEVKKLIIKLAEIENTIERLNINIQKIQKRANALKDIIIPRNKQIAKAITDILDEREREEFSRLKVVKKNIS